MSDKPLITASIVSFNDAGTAINAARSIKANTKKYPLKLYVIDNGSKNISADLRKQADVFLENKKNLGFGKAHNRILECEMGKYHAVINPDISVDCDVLSQLADVLEKNPDICMITPKILNIDGSEQKLPKRHPNAKYVFAGRLACLGGPFKKIRDEYIKADFNFTDITDVDFCTGCFFMIKSDVFKQIGGFDDRYFMYMEDADLTRQAQKFGRTVFYPDIAVTHLWERGSAKKIKLLLIHLQSFFKYINKWKEK